MYTIWFAVEDEPSPHNWLKIDVPAGKSVDLARQVWDKMYRGGFFMKSSRP